MIGMGVCVAAYMTKSALKFLEKNVATKVSDYKTSLWRVFSLCASSNYIEIKCCFYDFYICCFFLRFDSYFAWFCQISHHCRGNSRRRRRSCCPSPHPPVQWNFQNIWNIQIIHLTKLPNEIFRIFKILKMWEKYFRKQNCLACLWSMHWVLLTHCLCWANSLEWSLRLVKKLAVV